MVVQPISPVTDADLVARSRAGDDRAFRDLLQRYLPMVYSYLYRITQNSDTADDLAQEVFVKVYRNLNTYDANRPFKPWVLRIASNTAMSRLRRDARVVSLDALAESGQLREADYGPATPDASYSAEVAYDSTRVLVALEKLDARYRQVLLLRYREDLPYEAIAENLGIPLNTVRTWIRRGREQLRQQVQALSEGVR